jgi:hypothetical protein
VHSLAEFWEGWKNDYNPRHYPLLALLTNGVNYNTPPVWSQIPPFWLQPGTPYTYDLALKVADAETPDNLLTYTVTGQGYGRHNHPQPITINVSGSQVTVTISSSEPDGYGYAFLSATANDWITTSTLPHFKAIWGNEGDDTQEIDRASRAGAVPLQFGFQGERVLSTTARFALALPIRSAGSVTVFDLQGRLVRTLRDGEQPAGEHVIEWNGASDSGVRVQPGVYFVAARYSAGHATLRTSVIR